MTSSTPLPRRIPRREVLAFIALNGEELHMPHSVEFREYVYEGDEYRVITLEVETEAAVRFWAQVFGHRHERWYSYDYAATADRPAWTKYRSGDTWRGWLTRIDADVKHGVAAPESSLKVSDEARLREIAGGEA